MDDEKVAQHIVNLLALPSNERGEVILFAQRLALEGQPRAEKRRADRSLINPS